jgi:hypothetical protein
MLMTGSGAGSSHSVMFWQQDDDDVYDAAGSVLLSAVIAEAMHCP